MIVKETSACDLPILVLTVAIDVERTLQFVRGSVGVKNCWPWSFLQRYLTFPPPLGRVLLPDTNSWKPRCMANCLHRSCSNFWLLKTSMAQPAILVPPLFSYAMPKSAAVASKFTGKFSSNSPNFFASCKSASSSRLY
ncbi:hypothetical protein Plhal710r2_c006g0027091 [Plasmopara halstedii]